MRMANYIKCISKTRRILLVLSIVIAVIRIIYICTETEIENYYECSTNEDIPESVVYPSTESLNLIQSFKLNSRKLNSIEQL